MSKSRAVSSGSKSMSSTTSRSKRKMTSKNGNEIPDNFLERSINVQGLLQGRRYTFYEQDNTRFRATVTTYLNECGEPNGRLLLKEEPHELSLPTSFLLHVTKYYIFKNLPVDVNDLIDSFL